MTLMRFLISLLMLPLAPLAGPQRVLAFRPGALGNVIATLAALAVIAVAFPKYYVLICSKRDEDRMLFDYSIVDPDTDLIFLCTWLALMAWGLVMTVVRWTGKFPLREGVSRSWFGKWEPAFAIALAAVTQAACQTGPFFLISYACSLAHVGLWNLRAWCAAVDATKLFAPVTACLSPVTAGLFWLFRRGPVDATYKPPTFGSRVMSHVVGSMVLSLLYGAINFRQVARVFGLVLAVPLWLLGWDLKAPDEVKEEAQSIFARAEEVVGEKKAAVREIVREKGGELREEMREKREELTDEAERRAKKALWGSIFN